MDKPKLHYLTGFASHWESQALPDALPIGQNSPKKTPYGLYPEQLSGSAFTRPRHANLRSWLYRILPSVKQGDFTKASHSGYINEDSHQEAIPNQLRWSPLSAPSKPIDFVQSWQAIAANGSARNLDGAVIYLYYANQSMQDSYFYNADGELLIVPYLGQMLIQTEMGPMEIEPGEIACIPRGIKFSVTHSHDIAGYILENFASPFELPNLGPIGANGLANPRDFQIPQAQFEDKQGNFKLYCKYANKLWQASLGHSPLDVVAWHGNYAPYKYNLTRFNTIGTVSFDHPDPSIFTVLTSPSQTPGVANIDFVIFPERWMVAEDTFRPPYYHRNIMSEFMGLIYGDYDAKADDFMPGGGSLHNCMSSHGPDADSFMQGIKADNSPVKQKDTLAFMFESNKPWIPTAWALNAPIRQSNYVDCWQNVPKLFNGEKQI